MSTSQSPSPSTSSNIVASELKVTARGKAIASEEELRREIPNEEEVEKILGAAEMGKSDGINRGGLS